MAYSNECGAQRNLGPDLLFVGAILYPCCALTEWNVLGTAGVVPDGADSLHLFSAEEVQRVLASLEEGVRASKTRPGFLGLRSNKQAEEVSEVVSKESEPG